MDELKKKIEELKAKLAELAAGERTLDVAKQILAARDELKSLKAELGVREDADAAIAEGEAEAAAEAQAEADAKAAAASGDGDDDDSEDAEVETADAAVAVLAASAGADSASPTAHGDDAKPALTLTASASMPGISAGQSVDRDGVRGMLNTALRASASNSESAGSLFRVNTHAEGATPVRSSASAIENTRAMNAAYEQSQKPYALTAAGCFCGPDNVDRTIREIGDTDRPVAALFGSSPLESTGSFRYVRGLTLTDVQSNGGVDIWTCDDQALVDANDPDTWKTCATLDCFDEETVIPYFIKGCAIIEKPHQFAHPEQVDHFINMLHVDYARKAERQLLDIIEADAGTPLAVGNAGMAGHGLLSQLIYGLGSLEHPLAYEHRSGSLEGHVLLVSTGFAKALLADEHLRGFNHNKKMSELMAKIEGDYGLRLAVRKDESTAMTAGSLATVAALNAGGDIDTAPPALTPDWRAYIIDPSNWRRGEGVFVGADWVNDSNLIRQNRTMFFWENIEFLERVGPRKAYALDLAGCINGARSDLVGPPSCTP